MCSCHGLNSPHSPRMVISISSGKRQAWVSESMLTQLPTPLLCIKRTPRWPPSQAPARSATPSSSVVSGTLRIAALPAHKVIRRVCPASAHRRPGAPAARSAPQRSHPASRSQCPSAWSRRVWPPRRVRQAAGLPARPRSAIRSAHDIKHSPQTLGGDFARVPASDAELAALRQFDTPTICNALELARARAPRAGLHHADPDLPLPAAAANGGLRAHRADPLVCRPACPRPSSAKHGSSTTATWRPGQRPQVSVIQDVDLRAGFGCFWGEVQSAIHKALGCQGLSPTAGCATSMPSRPIPGAVRQGHAFARLGARVAFGERSTCSACWCARTI